MATKQAGNAAEAKLMKAKDAVEEAKIVLYNARFDFNEAKRAFVADAKAHIKKLTAKKG